MRTTSRDIKPGCNIIEKLYSDKTVVNCSNCCSKINKIGRATSELQSLMRISYAVFCLKKKPIAVYAKNNNHKRSQHCTGKSNESTQRRRTLTITIYSKTHKK